MENIFSTLFDVTLVSLIIINPFVTDTQTTGSNKAQMMGLRATDELGARCDEARNSKCCERHEGMKIEIKIKETKMRRNENTRLMCQ